MKINKTILAIIIILALLGQYLTQQYIYKLGNETRQLKIKVESCQK